MNGIDLDAMRDRWAAANRDVDATLTLDVAAVRDALRKREKTAFGRHSGWLLVRLAGGGLVLAALLLFITTQSNDMRYLLLSLPLLALVLAEFVVDWREWRALARLDFSRPILPLRAELDALRTRRLTMSKWIFLTSFFAWLPMLLVFVRGVFGFDLLRVLDPGFVWINQAVTLAFIPTAMWTARWITRRYEQTPGFQRFLEDVAGRSWSKARQALDARLRFDDEAQADPAGALRRRAPIVLPPTIAAPLRALKWRIGIAIGVFAVLIVTTGVFNGTHGGQWPVLVPGIALHVFWLLNMIAAIVHANFVARTDFAAPPAQAAAFVTGIGELRGRFARWILVASPVAAVMLARVVGGADAMASVPWPWLLVGMAAASGVLLALSRGAATAGWSRVFDVIAFGALSRSRVLAEALSRQVD